MKDSWCSVSWKLNEIHNDLPFLPERKKNWKIRKVSY